MTPPRLQHPIGPETLAEIGDLTVSAALMESALQQLAWTLLGADQRTGQIATCELSFRRILDLVRSLYLERRGRDQGFNDLMALTGQAGRLYDKRNVIIHSVWAAADTGYAATRVRMTARGNAGFKAEFEKIKSGQVSAVGREMQELAWKVQRFDIQLVDGTL